MFINYHLFTDFYQEYIHFDKNLQKMSWLRFEPMNFCFKTSFTGESVYQEKNRVPPNIHMYSNEPFVDIWYGLREKWLTRVGPIKKSFLNKPTWLQKSKNKLPITTRSPATASRYNPFKIKCKSFFKDFPVSSYNFRRFCWFNEPNSSINQSKVCKRITWVDTKLWCNVLMCHEMSAMSWLSSSTSRFYLLQTLHLSKDYEQMRR